MTKLKHLAKKCTKTLVSLFDGTLTASPTIGTWPSGITGRCKVTISSVSGHTDCNGSITIGSETLTFAVAGTKQTTVLLTAKPTVTSSGLDCHCHITVINSSGEDIWSTTETDLACRIWQKRKAVQDNAGMWTSIQETIAWVRDLTIIPGDIIKFDLLNKKDPTNGIEYKVSAIDPIEGPGGTEHMRILRF